MKKFATALSMILMCCVMNAQIGKVGINTSTPQAMLHVQDSSVLFNSTANLPGSPGSPPASGIGSRMMWYPQKAAFRAGLVHVDVWDKNNIGSISFAANEDTKASGWGSSAFGCGTIASNSYSFATGFGTEANGQQAFTSGRRTEANATYSAAMGFHTTTNAYASLVLGQYNSTNRMNYGFFPHDQDVAFVIGNGTDDDDLSNAVTILKGGRTGINTDDPQAMLHVMDSSVVFTGLNPLPGSPAKPPFSGAGTRMMWYPDKAAFRAGGVTSSQWNKDSIGNYSIAMGYNTLAKSEYSIGIGYHAVSRGDVSVAIGNAVHAIGNSSVALGFFTSAIGAGSTAIGLQTTAIGYSSTSFGEATHAFGASSTAMGYLTKANGIYSTAMGYVTAANGNRSTAMGSNTIARPFASMVLGQYNDTTTLSTSTWNLLDPVFIVGNGTSNSLRSNAMTVLKNGNVSIGSDVSPNALLHISKGTGGGHYHSNAAFIIEDNATSYIQLSNPDNISNGILSGNTDTDIRSGIIFFGDSSISFRAGGNNTKMTIENNGFIGMGTTSPDYLLEVNGTVGKPGGGSWTNSSDIRLKKDIHPYTDGLQSLLKINPVTYHYNEVSGFDTGPEYVGVIAQQLQEVAPYMVSVSNKKTEDDVNDYLQVDNSAMTYMLINAVKEQQQMIHDQQRQIDMLINELKIFRQQSREP